MSRKRLNEDEVLVAAWIDGAAAVRFRELLATVKQRTYATKTDIVKELLGIVPPKALTENEIHYFRTGEKKKE